MREDLQGSQWQRRGGDVTLLVVDDPGGGGPERKLLVENIVTGRRHRTSALQLKTRFRIAGGVAPASDGTR